MLRCGLIKSRKITKKTAASYDHEHMSVDGWTRNVNGVPQSVADQSLTIVLQFRRFVVDSGPGHVGNTLLSICDQSLTIVLQYRRFLVNSESEYVECPFITSL